MSIRFPDGLDRQRFLSEYWQKRPLLFRSAMPPASFPLSPEELAGLACEPEMESRLVIENGPRHWEVRHGPLSADDFASMPDKRWTLLVQDVDKYLPDVARLIELFDFVPCWRIDDIMVSYAADEGGVGPHLDAYDVFLMQGSGERRWRIGHDHYRDEDLIDGLELRILNRFDVQDDWVLQPGDMLYLPPGVAHWGTAVGECMTYSLGFRAPNQREIASEWFQFLIEQSNERQLRDTDDLDPINLARLSDGGVHEARTLLNALPTTDSRAFRCWLGRFLTEPKPQFRLDICEHEWDPVELRAFVHDGGMLYRHPWSRLAWTPLDPSAIALFFNGEFLTLPPRRDTEIDGLCRQTPLSRQLAEQLLDDEAMLEALTRLVNHGVFETRYGT